MTAGGSAFLAGDQVAALAYDQGEKGQGKSPWRLTTGEFLSSKIGVAGILIVVSMVLFSFVGPLVYHTNQVNADILRRNLPPSSQFPLGTDTSGFNVLGRLMVAGQSSLEVGLAMALISCSLGTVFGAISGFVGGSVDAVVMRVVDSLLAIPTILILLILAAIFTPSNLSVILVLGFMSWPGTARLVRGEVLSIKTREYIEASKMCGERPVRIVLRHVVRNVLSIVAVTATFAVATGILLLSSLSFLGLGPPPPAVNWGSMLTTGINYIFDTYWWLIYPAGICIVLTVIGFNFLGDAARETFDARLRRR